MAEYFVYMLRCSDGSLYTGVTNDWERRVTEHKEGLIAKSYTHNRRPLELVYIATFSEIMDAIAFEKQLKGWSRAKKVALIKGSQKLLEELSECKNVTHHRFFNTP